MHGQVHRRQLVIAADDPAWPELLIAAHGNLLALLDWMRAAAEAVIDVRGMFCVSLQSSVSPKRNTSLLQYRVAGFKGSLRKR